MTKSIVIFALCGIVANQPTPRIVVGAGTQSCGAWVEHRRLNSESDQIMAAILSTWSQGFIVGVLSGIRMAGGAQLAYAPPDSPAVQGWLDNHCKAKPLETILGASLQLVKELLPEK